MANTATRIERVTGTDEQKSSDIIFKYNDKDYSSCDATSFVVMKRLALTLAFSFYDHFTQSGFSTPLDYED